MPSIEHTGLIQHYIDMAQPDLESYGYVAVFLGIFAEGFGMPAPGESLVIAGALFASQGRMHIVVLLLVAWSAAIIGDNLGYAIGRFGGRRLVLRHGHYIGIRNSHLEKVEHFFQRYGGGIVMNARFFEVLRQLNGVVAGISAMPWWRFLAYNAIGAIFWVGVWGLGVYMLGQHIEQILVFIKRIEPYAIGTSLITLAVIAAFILMRNRTERPGR